jgi:hypothetical protein
MYILFQTISPMKGDLEWSNPPYANSFKIGSLVNYGQSVRRNIVMWCCCSWMIFKNIYLWAFAFRWWKCLALVLCLLFWLQCVQNVFKQQQYVYGFHQTHFDWAFGQVWEKEMQHYFCIAYIEGQLLIQCWG